MDRKNRCGTLPWIEEEEKEGPVKMKIAQKEGNDGKFELSEKHPHRGQIFP